MIILQNDQLKAAIHSKGAELQSLVHKNGLEYMWSGDAAYWGKHSPILFPIVGTLKDDTYFYKGKAYKLPRHGFARDMEFTAEQVSEQEAVFTLSDNEQTRAVYPFAFQLQLKYRLRENHLLCSYAVINTGDDNLYFSVGGHPAFALPLEQGASYDDYFLSFSETEPLMRYKLHNGLITDDKERLETISNEHGMRLPLTPSLFYDDAIVLKHLQNHNTTLASDKHPHGLTFGFTGFPFLGIWAAKDAPFICIEPWCGITDNVSHDQKLENKEGIIELQRSGTWGRMWTATCF